MLRVSVFGFWSFWSRDLRYSDDSPGHSTNRGHPSPNGVARVFKVL